MKEIKISDNWILSADDYNFVLKEYGYKINPKDKTENWGEIKTTYHRTIEQVFDYILNRSMYKAEFKEFEDLVKVAENVRELFKAFKINSR